MDWKRHGTVALGSFSLAWLLGSCTSFQASVCKGMAKERCFAAGRQRVPSSIPVAVLLSRRNRFCTAPAKRCRTMPCNGRRGLPHGIIWWFGSGFHRRCLWMIPPNGPNVPTPTAGWPVLAPGRHPEVRPTRRWTRLVLRPPPRLGPHRTLGRVSDMCNE